LSISELREKAEKEWQDVISPSRPQILVGLATCGQAAGASAVYQAIESMLGRGVIDAGLHTTGCLGMCHAEPLVDIIKPGRPRITYGRLDAASATKLVKDYIIDDNPRPELALGVWGDAWGGIADLSQIDSRKCQARIALSNAGVIDPQNIMHYIARGGYSSLELALGGPPEDIISEVEKARLRGRGGAGFPTASKWQHCRQAGEPPKYLICNADEGDPGAFMDRVLLDSDPHSVLEGMLIGAYAIGASRGFIYIRTEYPLAIERLKTAIDQMNQHNLLGDNIMGSAFSFDIEIRESAGAFICGEETALIASIEGERGTPRIRPPFPAENGLWGQPTVINNVETWANIPIIIRQGADWFAAYGTDRSKGTKTFALAGDINLTGLIEVPLGTTLKEVIYDVGGGVPGGKAFKAVQTGGPSGGCLPVSRLDMPIDFDSLSAAGSMMGSGGMVVMDEDTCIVDVARYFLDFSRKESCGQCLPCRLGTEQMFNILDDIANGKGKPEDIDVLLELCEAMTQTSLCAFGQTAPNPVLTTLRYFRDEYAAHINNRQCPAGVCQALAERGRIED
jgi:NADH:ubiquinone oxidoreductase subunit F (NADH-binding)/(2Fe-2S) ferredoxin